uniref:keratin, type I cytoskeletal 19-like n=1 Tax=Pristiophorus japonicus TaxID=55135 RepID=UPI00398F453E
MKKSSSSFIGSSSRSGMGGYSKAVSLYGGSSAGLSRSRMSSVTMSNYGSGASTFSMMGSGGGFGGVSLSTNQNEKQTMQNLNERLATYLEQVRSLEASNSKLELEIRQFYDMATPATRDLSAYWKTIEGLRDQINGLILGNTSFMLQVDNSKLAADDFRIKFETELGIRMAVEGDINNLRTMLDEMTLDKSQLEMQIEGLKEELIYIRKNHEEELKGLRGQMSGNVTVQVQSEDSVNLAALLAEVRKQYEDIANKNKNEVEEWYKQQCVTVQKEQSSNTQAIEVEKTQLSQLRHTLQGLEAELQTHLSVIASLQGSLQETELRYMDELNRIQIIIGKLEAQMAEIRASAETHKTAYADLLNIKCRLEMEIATYRRLLEGEGHGSQRSTSQISIAQNIKVVEKVTDPVITIKKKVMTVKERIVDGVVVSSHMEEVDVE